MNLEMKVLGLLVGCKENEDFLKTLTPKGQIISKANFEFSFEPKIERKYFSISALGL